MRLIIGLVPVLILTSVYFQETQVKDQQIEKAHISDESVKGIQTSPSPTSASRKTLTKNTTNPTTSPTTQPTTTPNPTESSNSQPQNQTPAPTSTPTSAPTSTVSTGHLPIKGSDSAKVTIVEFSDFQCPFCRAFYTNTLSQIESEYVNTGKVRFAYRHFPLSFHQNAEIAALASECANEQGKFWDMHNLLFTEQSSWQSDSNPLQTFVTFASSIGADSSRFQTCMQENRYSESINDDKNAATSLGLNGTPTFFINNQKIVGALPYQDFKNAIEAELSK